MIAWAVRIAAAFRSASVGRIRAFADWRERRRPPIAVAIVDEEPARPMPRMLHVSMRAGEPAVGWLVCPCGCGDLISLRLSGRRSPRWHLRRADDPATLVPSIWRKGGCCSHFILRDGRVQWC